MFEIVVFCKTYVLKHNSGTNSQNLSFYSLDRFFLAQKQKNIEFSNFSTLQQNSLISLSSPATLYFSVLGGLTENNIYSSVSKEIIEYMTGSEDTITSLSKKFGISEETIMWANNLEKKSKLKPGQKLIIPPISGVIYYVKKGDTLKEISREHKAAVKEIILFNELVDEGDIYIGDILVIPHGVKIKKKYLDLKFTEIPLGSNYFISPVSHFILTQGLHDNNAVDLANKCGTPIYASAQGKVLRAKLDQNFGGGNYITILHPNGVVTYYGHLREMLVNPGEEVSQGQMIGLMGGKPGDFGSGISTGCHLHFGVIGAKNPFAK